MRQRPVCWEQPRSACQEVAVNRLAHTVARSRSDRPEAPDARVFAVMRALAAGCGYKSGRPDPDILSHREPCCWGAASLGAGEPLPDSGAVALAMLLIRVRVRPGRSL